LYYCRGRHERGREEAAERTKAEEEWRLVSDNISAPGAHKPEIRMTDITPWFICYRIIPVYVQTLVSNYAIYKKEYSFPLIDTVWNMDTIQRFGLVSGPPYSLFQLGVRRERETGEAKVIVQNGDFIRLRLTG
jgi:hypothetical protein